MTIWRALTTICREIVRFYLFLFFFQREEARGALRGVPGQGEREALRGGLVRRVQGVLQEEHQEAIRGVSFC